MKLDILIFQIGVLFLPGLLWARIDAQYGLKRKPTETEFFIRAFQFGLFSYGALYLIYWLFGKPFHFVDFAGAGQKDILDSSVVPEVLQAVLLGFILSLLWVYAATYKILTRFLQFIKATKKYGDEDIWDYVFNSSVAAVEYLHFRDFQNQIVYAGWVLSFSETEKMRELALRDVIVYDFEGNIVFETPMIYLARAPENIHIEFPYQPKGKS